MIEALFLAAGLATGYMLTWREISRFRVDLAFERNRVSHLLELVSRKEAPVEEAWYMGDKNPAPPVVPENALWDDSGLYWTEPDE